MELYGDLGETGVFELTLDSAIVKGDKMDVSFRVEAVSVGRVQGARVYFEPTAMGAEVYEGFAALQELLQKRSLDLSTSNDWVVSYVILRESLHTPYRYVLRQAKVKHRNTDEDPYVKELMVSEMEGMPTKISKKKAAKKSKPNWILSLHVSEGSNLLPQVTLCGEKDCVTMKVLDPTPTDNILSYQASADTGPLRKVRVGIDPVQRINVLPDEDADLEPRNFLYVTKMRVNDTVNGDELRFPAADVEFIDEFSVYEFPAIWPDQPPIPNVLYEARIVSGEASLTEPYLVKLNLFGNLGDVGYRAVRPQYEDGHADAPLVANSEYTFEFEACSIGDVKTAEIQVDCDDVNYSWECKEMVVTDTYTSLFYVFRFARPFTPTTSRQNCSVAPLTSAL
ncbi:doublecortin family protein [Aphelenchoides avenae]|nr:doublecortin family protein [Aphelenchus avenae]